MTYSNVRPETHSTRRFLIWQFSKNFNIVDLWEDGSDVMQITFADGREVQILFIDDAISLHELSKMLLHNTKIGVYTLFMFWSHLLLPSDGQRFVPQDWMAAMLALYGDRIYGYDIASRQVFVFPVYFRPQTGYAEYYIEWGKTVSLKYLKPDILTVESVYLSGQFRMAGFEVPLDEPTEDGPTADNYAGQNLHFGSRTALAGYYATLGIPMDASITTIRTAYRALARQHHPDINPQADSLAKMQQINAAYDAIMAQFLHDD